MEIKQIAELVAQCVDFTPVKAYRKTWTNNHKHIVEKRRLGEDVDNPVSVYWSAEWTICGLSDKDFVSSLGGDGEVIKFQVYSKTKKGVAEEFYKTIVLELAECIYALFYDGMFHNNEEMFDDVIAKMKKFVLDKTQQTS